MVGAGHVHVNGLSAALTLRCVTGKLPALTGSSWQVHTLLIQLCNLVANLQHVQLATASVPRQQIEDSSAHA